ncbi:MAG: methyltransferase domain-containing protein, partial [Roseobacter sp.]
DISGDELVLDVGGGYGYSSAVIARMAEAVVMVDDDENLIAEAQETLSNFGADNVIVHQGGLSEGAAQHGPYDVIVVQGGIVEFPEDLTAQLKEGGRVACLFVQNALGEVRIGRKHNGEITWRTSFNANASILKGFENTSEFKL